MKNLLLNFLVIAFLISFGAIAQKTPTSVSYAHKPIAVPANYKTSSEYEIKNDDFSAQWIYLTREMVEQGVHSQILDQIPSQLPVDEVGPIEFISGGGKFSGKKYRFKNPDGKKKFVVFAYGIVNNQPLILNLHFKNDPTSNKDFDELMKKFIWFNE